MGIPNLRTCHFEASENIITKFKSQGLHIIRIKYWKASGSGNPSSLIPALWNIGILLHKQATLGKHFEPECISHDCFLKFSLGPFEFVPRKFKAEFCAIHGYNVIIFSVNCITKPAYSTKEQETVHLKDRKCMSGYVPPTNPILQIEIKKF